MKIFITAKYQSPENQKYLDQLRLVVKQAGFEDFCFATDIVQQFSTSKDLMLSAQKEILKCDALLFDATQPATGRAIEVGIAFQANKKIIVICQRGTVINNPLKGVADLIIEYDDISDIQKPLSDYLLKSSIKY